MFRQSGYHLVHATKGRIDSPGFMREYAKITFPLSRNALLIGSSEPIKYGHHNTYPKRTSPFTIASQHATANDSWFSTVKDFCWLDKESKVRYDFGLLAKPLNHRQ